MKRRTIREAVIESLKRTGRPLSVNDIYYYIMENDLYRFNAQDPPNIVKIEIRRHCEGVDFPTARPEKYFQILHDGRYWIKDVQIPDQSIASARAENKIKKDTLLLKGVVAELSSIHEKHVFAFKQQILSQLINIEPKAFEVFARNLLIAYGFEQVQVTSYVKDGGIDGYGQLKVGISYLNVAFQCKRWKNSSVSRTEIDKFRGAIQGEYEQGIIFTTSTFTKDALAATRRKGAVPIILIDGNAMIDIMIEKKFGVDIESIPIYINALDRVLA
jgi:restriction system protein